MVVHPAHQLIGASLMHVETGFFFSKTFFVMDKECTMRAPKTRLYGVQPTVRIVCNMPQHARRQVLLLVLYNI